MESGPISLSVCDVGSVGNQCASILRPHLPLSRLCAEVPGLVSEWTDPCGGYIAVSWDPPGVQYTDCYDDYVFEAVSGKLTAIVHGCNDVVGCVAGDARFQPPMDPDAATGDPRCLISHNWFDLCLEAGAPPLPDGAGAGCTSDSQCPPNYRCIYRGIALGSCPPSGPCGAQPDNGVCLSPLDLSAGYPNCVPTSACACDGTTAQGCVSPQGSVGNFYFNKFVALPGWNACGGWQPNIPDGGLKACPGSDQ